MTKLSNVEIAYEFLKQEKKALKFDAIWQAVEKVIGEQNKNKNSLIAELYSDLVLEKRFSVTADGSWAIKGIANIEDIKSKFDEIDALTKPKKVKPVLEESEEIEEEVEEEIEDDLEDDDDEIFEDEQEYDN